MKMPMLFVGHGSPMNAIEENKFTQAWEELGKKIGKPRAIVAISAHWFTQGSYTQTLDKPRQIYDMYGFPKDLYELVYPAKGDSALGKRLVEEISEIQEDNSWGIDHGVWSVLTHMYPEAEIPIVQISLDAKKSFQEHFDLGKKLSFLREEGVLIFASGNILHNLYEVDWKNQEMTEKGKEFDDYVQEKMEDRDVEALLKIQGHPLYSYAVPQQSISYPSFIF